VAVAAFRSRAVVASFLHRVFLVPNVRVMAASDMAEALNDTLYEIRQMLGETPSQNLRWSI